MSRVVEREALGSQTEATARSLAALDQGAVRAMKDAVRQGTELPLREGLELETRLALTVMGNARI